MFSQLVTRQIDPDMKGIGECIVRVLQKCFPYDSVRDFNHMTVLLYTGEFHKRCCRLGFHRDQQYNAHGEFMTKQNSQQENSFTCILTIGDSRELEFRPYHHQKGNTGERKCTTKRYGHYRKKFTLSHGSLFILHHDDEKLLSRNLYGERELCFFKHGNVMFGGEDELSIAFVFRVTTVSSSVSRYTGEHYMTETEYMKDREDHMDKFEMLEKFIGDTAAVSGVQQYLQASYDRLRRIYKF